ncbi:hypothetical protein KAFR_0I01710 [Kazachstania africana CBS 2517]|uniref:DUF676 domain-containing protein n=1 Tax=Kazachstania africana (strain ATCC 22294 / BCRC 22015 / CBS 2517 / CECT 1963 / NBRC 1671 / NRRL Y-8276) TaxID=1071382 RepID=H2B002_KAZAF|nr:hypothetical protein KAFR_0I01710 [Kazachstania africana CBS 2517]CCF59952.1 hypothetical protein KAFR_0I01710 [Kazachstania africana CBS 2517]
MVRPSFTQLADTYKDISVRSFVARYNQFLQNDRSPHKHDIEAPNSIRSILPNPNYIPPKNPIVLCHGLSGFDQLILLPSVQTITKLLMSGLKTSHDDYFVQDYEESQSIVHIEYWIGIKEMLERQGCTVITTKVPPFGSIEERATALSSFLEYQTAKLRKGKEKIKLNLIAHSMGGLDCRYLISKLPQKENYEVISLTTISTPHHGSEMADFIVNLFENMKLKLKINQDETLPICFYQLTTNYMKYFNLTTQNDPRVSYFSYGSYFIPKWYNVFSLSWKIIDEATNGKENDGMVTVESSNWGQYQGTLVNVDHLDIINWKNKMQKDINKLFERKASLSDEEINIVQFYLQITDELAKRGF